MLVHDVGLDDRNVFVPDVSWYSSTGAPDVHGPRPYPMPDLAIEVRSPSTWVYDIGAKRAGYERRRLPELWLVDTTAEKLLVFRRSKPESQTFDVALELSPDEALRSPLLPGFALALEDLFRPT
jgi:Uma2 family endonuclease